MKFTSEDLLKAMGLKIGDTFKVGKMVYEIVIDDNQTIVRRLSNDGEYVLYGIGDFLNYDYEIIQPKPTLTEDEKVILKNLPKKWKWIVRDLWENNLALYDNEKPLRLAKDEWTNCNGGSYTEIRHYNHLFQFIKWEDEPYSIEELLGESE